MLKKVKSVEKKTLASGKDIWNVAFEDGVEGSCWDNSFEGKIGTEVDVIISQKEGSQFKNAKLNVPKAGFGGGAPRNYRPEALACAVSWCKGGKNPVTLEALTSKDVLAVADVFHTWIKGS